MIDQIFIKKKKKYIMINKCSIFQPLLFSFFFWRGKKKIQMDELNRDGP